MSAVGQAGQYAGDVMWALAYACEAALAACALLCAAEIARGLLGWLRKRGTPPAPLQPVGRDPWVPEDGEPLTDEEERVLAETRWHLRNDARRRAARRRGRPARNAIERAGWR